MTQFPASNDEKWLYIVSEIVISCDELFWFTENVSQNIIWSILVTFHCLVWNWFENVYHIKPCRIQRWNMETKGFFSIWKHQKCFCYLFPLHLNTYVLEIFQFSRCGTVFIHQNLTSIEGKTLSKTTACFNPLTAKLFNLNFHPLEAVSRSRDPQLQVGENYSDLTKWRSSLFKSCRLMSHFIFNMFKMWYLMC